MADIIDVIRRLRKLDETEESGLAEISQYLTGKDARVVKGLLKERKVEIVNETISVGGITQEKRFPQLRIKRQFDDTEYVEEMNSKITNSMKSSLFEDFSKVIIDKCDTIIAPEIVGFEYVKKAVALQLFTPERIHILLLGDPGTGKTKVLDSATRLAPKSSMGLGSGTSGVGLAVTVKGKEVLKGLLPMADEGLCAIDELNLMKEESRASLYNAMESGFVSYDKGGHSYKFDARVSVLATANPKGDKFVGKNVEELKKQLPFDAALLSRFHLTFFVRKHDIEQFKEITRSLLKGGKRNFTQTEQDFLDDYITQARTIVHVKLPKKYEQEIVEFIADIKRNESQYLVEVSPRMVVGFSRLAKACARMQLRDEVNQADVSVVKNIVTASLKIY